MLNLNKIYFNLVLILLLVVQTMTSIAANVSEIAIISNKNIKTHQQIVESFQETITRHHSELKFLLLDSDETEVEVTSPALVFGVGVKAVNQSLNKFSNQDLVATVISTNKLLANKPNATSVLLKNSILNQLKWHKHFLPGIKNVGILYNPQKNQSLIDEAREIAVKLELKIIAVPVTSAKELLPALKVLGRKADSILAIRDKTIYSAKTAKTVLLYSFRNKIPFVGLSKAWVKAGALYALDWDYSDLGQQCATISSQILNGKAIKSMEPQSFDKQIYLVNLKTAKHMKLELSHHLIDGAFKTYQ